MLTKAVGDMSKGSFESGGLGKGFAWERLGVGENYAFLGVIRMCMNKFFPRTKL